MGRSPSKKHCIQEELKTKIIAIGSQILPRDRGSDWGSDKPDY